jgi:hypothetical protein
MAGLNFPTMKSGGSRGSGKVRTKKNRTFVMPKCDPPKKREKNTKKPGFGPVLCRSATPPPDRFATDRAPRRPNHLSFGATETRRQDLSVPKFWLHDDAGTPKTAFSVPTDPKSENRTLRYPRYPPGTHDPFGGGIICTDFRMYKLSQS